MNIDEARVVEHEKYSRSYKQVNYRMSAGRMRDAVGALEALPERGWFLDVGCGRGELMVFADYFGYHHVKGTEVVTKLLDGDRIRYAEVHALPFPAASFDTVCMFDVIEHLIPGDDELACRELARVARRHILVAANNRNSKNRAGDTLHINIRPYEEWDRLFREWFAPHDITWLSNTSYFSQIWRINLK